MYLEEPSFVEKEEKLGLYKQALGNLFDSTLQDMLISHSFKKP